MPVLPCFPSRPLLFLVPELCSKCRARLGETNGFAIATNMYMYSLGLCSSFFSLCDFQFNRSLTNLLMNLCNLKDVSGLECTVWCILFITTA